MKINTSNPAANDSDDTTKVKQRFIKWTKDHLHDLGYKVWITEENPANFGDINYNIDLGVLYKHISSFDQYHYFGIEIDGDIGHNTKITNEKDKKKDKALKSIGVPLLRLYLYDFTGNTSLEKVLFEEELRDFITKRAFKIQSFSELNVSLAQRLKENQLLKCACGHEAQNHSLAGCNERFSKCECKDPFMVSNRS